MSTQNLNSYGGRNKWSVPIGTTRNSKGSANRMYQYSILCNIFTNSFILYVPITQRLY